jgi:hypothetical protein
MRAETRVEALALRVENSIGRVDHPEALILGRSAGVIILLKGGSEASRSDIEAWIAR